MSATEIIMIIIGVGVFLLGYFLPARKKDVNEGVQLISEAEVRRMVEAEVKDVREKISDIVDETVNYSIEKTERAMERVANEKIMAVNEYSDTVLEEINKNHKEVVFLYDMLNDKHDNLMVTINEASQAADEIKQTVKDAEVTAREAAQKVKDAEDAAQAAILKIQDAEATAREAKEAVQEAVESVMGAVQDTRTDLWSLHSAREYRQDVVQEVQTLAGNDENDKAADSQSGMPEAETLLKAKGNRRRTRQSLHRLSPNGWKSFMSRMEIMWRLNRIFLPVKLLPVWEFLAPGKNLRNRNEKPRPEEDSVRSLHLRKSGGWRFSLPRVRITDVIVMNESWNCIRQANQIWLLPRSWVWGLVR